MEFVCQRCGKILEVDESLQCIDFSLVDKDSEELNLENIITSTAPPSSIPVPTTPTTSAPTTPTSTENAKRSFMSSSGSFFMPSNHNKPPPSRQASFIEPPAIPDRTPKDKNMTGAPFGVKISPLLTSRSASSFDILADSPATESQLPGIAFNSPAGNRLKSGTQSLRMDISRRGTVSGLKYIRQASKLTLGSTREKEKEGPTTNEVLASKLFRVASEQIGVDVPLCGECAKTLSAEVDEEFAMMEAQLVAYTSFADQLEQKEKKWTQSHDDLDAEIQRMEEEEASLRQQLMACDQQRESQAQEMAYLKGEADRLTSFEERFWQHFDEFHVNLSSYLDDRDACRVQTVVLTETLELLKKTHIINDAFHIWHDGHFGTINTFRLGRLPSQPVDWNEINAAWGLAVLLLASMAKKIGFTFSTYKLVPCGSCSKVERTDNSSSYELFGSSDISLGRLFWYRRFDNGMVAFLVCLKEMGDYAEARDKQFKLPYKMEKDKIGDMSIKIQFNNEETWTKSLKYMLTNLKWLLAWIVKTDAEQTNNLVGVNTTIGSINSNPTNINTNNNNNSQRGLVSKLLSRP